MGLIESVLEISALKNSPAFDKSVLKTRNGLLVAVILQILYTEFPVAWILKSTENW